MTVVRAIKAKVVPATKVLYVKGCDVIGGDTSGFQAATQAAKDAELAVVVVGENGRTPRSTVKATTWPAWI